MTPDTDHRTTYFAANSLVDTLIYPDPAQLLFYPQTCGVLLSSAARHHSKPTGGRRLALNARPRLLREVPGIRRGYSVCVWCCTCSHP
ncbi:hypothetical protein DSL92_06905 [Billgrantia gudaonensis]|uniref:Uncharacterized protein n=1 Tax=Billgrantia gudaonensis TaxID=376427 RepID=A0A3S0VSJ8_9GAMM|nr:hypothetical protein DSL92_06905 [Halomonas gudaonensis]